MSAAPTHTTSRPVGVKRPRGLDVEDKCALEEKELKEVFEHFHNELDRLKPLENMTAPEKKMVATSCRESVLPIVVEKLESVRSLVEQCDDIENDKYHQDGLKRIEAFTAWVAAQKEEIEMRYNSFLEELASDEDTDCHQAPGGLPPTVSADLWFRLGCAALAGHAIPFGGTSYRCSASSRPYDVIAMTARLGITLAAL